VIEKENKDITIRKLWAADDVAGDYGSPSPDGRYFAFHHYKTGDLAVRDVATGEVRRLFLKNSYVETMEMVGYCCWSPDGQQIAYEWTSKPGEIRIVNVDGSNQRTVYRSMNWVSPYAWSPDGKHLLIFLMKEGRTQYQFGMLNVEDGSMREFDRVVDPSPAAGFSPDGRAVALTILQDDKPGKRDVSLFWLTEGREVPLVELPSDEHMMGWSPDGKWVFFWSDRSGTPDLWAVQVDTAGMPQGEPELIKKSMGTFGNSWMTRTGVIYYSVDVSNRDVYVAKLEFDSNRVLESPTRATEHYANTNFAPAWSSDGEFLAFASKREEEPSRVLCILSNRTGEVREFFPQLRDFRNPTLIFLPSGGGSIVHTGIDESYGIGMFRTDLKTGDMSGLFQDGPGQIRGARLSLDTKTMFYNKMNRQTKMSQLLTLNLETQKTEELYECEFLQGLALSPDGNMLAFSEEVVLGERERICELRILPVQGGEPRTLFRTEKGGWIQTLDWTPDGRYLLFSQMKAENEGKNFVDVLWMVSVSGGNPQETGITMDSIGHLRIHPDGQQIAFTAGKRGKEVWAMENILPKGDNKK
jgi:Tol biopolymer transport system component